MADTDFAGATVRGANFESTTARGFTPEQLYATASYMAGDLRGVRLGDNNLTGWNFAGQDMTGASFRESRDSSVLVDADFSDAQVRGVNFHETTELGFTAEQLYSTASYQAGDLDGIDLSHNDLTGWNFAEQDLEDASFGASDLSNANFSGAVVRGADFSSTTYRGFTAQQLYSTASYQDGNLVGINLGNNHMIGWNFAGQDLTDALLSNSGLRIVSGLTNADFTGAIIHGVHFGSTIAAGFTAEQLYSTASYQQGDLGDIDFSGEFYTTDLSGWDFSGQNLAAAAFRNGSLFGTDFSGANLTDTDFYNTSLATANLRGADTRGAIYVDEFRAENFIDQAGHMEELRIAAGEIFRLWDYDAEQPLPITVRDGMQVASDGRLRVVIEDAHWGSTLVFEGRAEVALDGMLELVVDVDDETSAADLVGTTYTLFDWTAVSPTGSFEVVSDYRWDISQVYNTGQVTLLAVPEPMTVELMVAVLAAWILATRRQQAMRF